jgi:hypothetical protein
MSLGTAYVAGGPYIAAYMINVAVEKDDATGLTEHIDFPTLEQNIQVQIDSAKKKDAKRKKAGFVEEVFRAVGHGYLQDFAASASIPRTFDEFARDRAGKTGALFNHMRLQIDGIDQVSFYVKEPEGNERRYGFNRYSLKWKLTNIELGDVIDPT